jgi:hypothetical protein
LEGTAAMASREMAVMVGNTIMASTRAAGNMPGPASRVEPAYPRLVGTIGRTDREISLPLELWAVLFNELRQRRCHTH